MNTDRIVRLNGDVAEVVYSDGTKLVIGDTSAGQTTDEYHSIDDLYRHRLLLNAALCNAWYDREAIPFGDSYGVHKSRQHAVGEDPMFEGMFRVGAELPTGDVSWHYSLKDWDLFQIPEWDRASAWDGYTAADVANRLEAFLRS